MPLPELRADSLRIQGARVRAFTAMLAAIDDGTLCPGEALTGKDVARSIGITTAEADAALVRLAALDRVACTDDGFVVLAPLGNRPEALRYPH